MKFKFISKYFPPSKFLKPSHIGVSFSYSNIKAISFDKTLTEPSLKSVVIPIEKDSIVDGKIINMEDIVKNLLIVRKKFNSPFVVFAIPDELVYVFATSVMISPKSSATESIAFIMEENVPLPLDDIVFDFAPVEISRLDLEYKVSVVVAACVKKELKKFIEAFYKAGFEPVGAIHESQAITNSLAPKKLAETISIVHARKNRVGIYLVKNNLVHFSTLRSISDKNYKKQFLDEYGKFLDYCLKYGIGQDKPIKSVSICGEFEYAKKILEALIDSPKSTNNVKLSNVWTNIFKIDQHTPDIPYEESLNFAGPIGATISDIN